MESMLAFIHFLGLSAWIGGHVLLFAVVVPVLGRLLSDAIGDEVHEQILALFYPFSLGCGMAALASLVVLRSHRGGLPWFWTRGGLLLAMLALTVVAGWIVQPRIRIILHAAAGYDPRDEDLPRVEELGTLQKLVMQVNASVLFLGLVTLWLSVGGPAIG